MTTEFQRQTIASMSDAQVIVDYVSCCENYRTAFGKSEREYWDAARRLVWAELGFRGLRERGTEALQAERQKSTGTQQQ